MKGLASIQALPICQGCLKGGGNDECKIRPCASDRKLSDCIECNEIKTCKNLEALQKVHTGALHVGMLAKTDNGKSDQQLTKKGLPKSKANARIVAHKVSTRRLPNQVITLIFSWFGQNSAPARKLERIFLDALRFLYFLVERLQVCVQCRATPFFSSLNYDLLCDFPEGPHVIRTEIDYHFPRQVLSCQKSPEEVQEIAHFEEAFSAVTAHGIQLFKVL